MVADVVCPYCYIGLTRLQRAIAATAHTTPIDVSYIPFILQPHLPKSGVPKLEVLRQELKSEARAKRIMAQVGATAALDGLQFNVHGQRAGNSADAHRLLLWAGARMQSLFEAMAKAYNEQEEWLGDYDVLMRAVNRAGLCVDEASTVLLDPSAYADELEAGLRQAQELGVTSVPAFFVNEHLLGTGALSEGAIRAVIQWISAPVHLQAHLEAHGTVASTR